VEELRVDYLVLGSGIAGLRAAIGLARAGSVLVVTKAQPSESNTGYAQGGIAAAVGPDDSPALHAADTIRAGDGLCDEAAVRVLVEEGPRYVHELVGWGARFERAPDGSLALGLEAAHSKRRVLHVGDATGREIGRALWQHVVTLPSVQTIAHSLVTELVTEGRRVTGVTFFDHEGIRRTVHASATLLATGGAGQVFRETTNPAVATGDGIALAYRAGARVADLEFVQFHPTALSKAGAPRFLISEALRGEGAHLVNVAGERFMARYHADGDLAPRDVVARSIVREIDQTGGQVFLTLAHLDAAHVRRRFPTIAAMCAQVGIDIASDPIPVGPAAHYMMGGIDTDEWGRTSLPGLYAAGETACTGVHGANRLASNSLLEGLVFGARAAVAMRQPPQSAALEGLRPRGRMPAGTPAVPSSLADVQTLMWRQVGLVRDAAGLTDAVTTLDGWRRGLLAAGGAAADAPLAQAVTVAWLVARGALDRQESRGGHARADFPQRDDLHWMVHSFETAHDQDC
jgi:L-aspartate oxidase